jgi:hypothetical protein
VRRDGRMGAGEGGSARARDEVHHPHEAPLRETQGGHSGRARAQFCRWPALKGVIGGPFDGGCAAGVAACGRGQGWEAPQLPSGRACEC